MPSTKRHIDDSFSSSRGSKHICKTAASSHSRFDPAIYTVGWICAIETEFTAAKAMLDEAYEESDEFYVAANDNNSYALGRIGSHKVVIAVLPDGEYGTSSAAAVARDMLSSFYNVRIGLMVGVGGGAPSEECDIRLGDVVVSSPRGGRGGVLQYDFGKTIQEQNFQITGCLNQPPLVLRTAVNSLKSTHRMAGNQLDETIEEALQKWPLLRQDFQRQENDQLYRPEILHTTSKSCSGSCDSVVSSLVPRCTRDDNDSPVIHYGQVASANQLMEDAQIRDRLAKQEGVLCFEMEAAGLMNHFPCLVIRGVCDYADSHKNKTWQGYAAMAAAAYTKQLLAKVAPKRLELENRIVDTIASIETQLQTVTRNQETAQDGISRILDNQSDLLSRHQAARLRDLCDWLAPPDPEHDHHAARKKCEPGTGRWLLQSEEYEQWKASSNALLWLNGKAGCGKTVLCSTVIEDIRVECQNDPYAHLIFFYFSFSEALKQTYAGLLASLIAQLIRYKTIGDEMQQLYDRIHPKKPSTEALENILLSYLRSSQTFLVMDALDELQESDDSNGRPTVLGWLGPLIQRSKFANDDIRKYVATELEKHPRLHSLDMSMKETIKEVFEQKADGMFRWAFCQLETLKSLKSTKPKFIKKALDDLPGTLDATYERMLLQIDEMLWDEALKALRWLVFEIRPLTLSELVEACLIDYSSEQLVNIDDRGRLDDILEILAGFILVEDGSIDDDDVPNTDGDREDGDYECQNNVEEEHPAWRDAIIEAKFPCVRPINARSRVRLAHFSVKEYFLSNRILSSKVARFALSKDRDQTILAQSCLAYVLYYSGNISKKSSKQDLQTYPFLLYAAKTWTKLMPKDRLTQAGHERKLLGSETDRRNWLSIYSPDAPRWNPLKDHDNYDNHDQHEVGSALYYASFVGNIPLCRTFLEQNANVNARGGPYDFALCVASQEGHFEVVKLLLESGADINAQSFYHGNALQIAAREGHRDIVQSLLKAGADLDTPDGFNASSALDKASAGGHTSIVKMLLDAGSDVHAVSKHWSESNALWIASCENHQEVAKLLLDAGAEACENGIDALCVAAELGHQEMVKILLGSRARRDTLSISRALLVASKEGHQEVLKLLLNAGADANAYGAGGRALYAALESGSRGTMQLLLDAGADVSAQAAMCEVQLALHTALERGYWKVLKLLLDAGTKPEKLLIRNALCDTRVRQNAVSREGYEQVARLLQDTLNLQQ